MGASRAFDLVASDLDGTLLDHDEKVSARTLAAISRVLESGALFVIATGRPPRWIYPVIELTDHRGYAVGSNGAVIVDVHGNSPHEHMVLHRAMISVEETKQLVTTVRSIMPGIGIATDGPGGFCFDPHYIPTFAIPADAREGLIEDIIDEPVAKLILKHATDMSEHNYHRLVAAVGERGSMTYGSMEPNQSWARTAVEIMAPGVSKATALQWICEREGIAADRVMAFGDMPNDLQMLQWAGMGVAMANAPAWLQAKANTVTATNIEDGVAQMIEKFF